MKKSVLVIVLTCNGLLATASESGQDETPEDIHWAQCIIALSKAVKSNTTANEAVQEVQLLKNQG